MHIVTGAQESCCSWLIAILDKYVMLSACQGGSCSNDTPSCIHRGTA
jgi:hypothetical protein